MSAMYLAYTYYIRNKITNEFYYGSRCKNVKDCRTPVEDFWIYYFTSSNKVAQLIELYGTDSFDIQIIMENEDYDKCYFYEQELIDRHLAEELCLNKFCHLTNKFSMAGSIHTEETKVKLRIARKGRAPNKGKEHSEETKTKIGAAQKGKTISEEHKISIRDARKNQLPPSKGKKCSEETKAKISAAMIGHKGVIHSEETKTKLAAAKSGVNNPNYGKTFSEETKAKMSAAKKTTLT
jgi:hypothetical protein